MNVLSCWFLSAALVFAGTPAMATCNQSYPIAPAHPVTLAERFASLVAQDGRSDGPEVTRLWQKLADDAKSVRTTPIGLKVQIGTQLALLLLNDGENEKGLAAITEAQQAAIANRLQEQPFYAKTLAMMATALRATGKQDAALAMAETALVTAKRLTSESSAETGLAYNELSADQYALGRFNDAARNLEKSISIITKCYPATHALQLEVMNNYSSALLVGGDTEAGLTASQHAMHWALANAAESSSAYANALNNLAGALKEVSRLSEAEAISLKIVQLDAKNPATPVLDSAIDISNLAAVISDQGRYSDAEGLWLKSRELYQKAGDKLDPLSSATSLLSAANGAQARGDIPLALTRRATAIAEMEKAIAADRPELAYARIEHANALLLAGRTVEAKAFATLGINALHSGQNIKTNPSEYSTNRMNDEMMYAHIIGHLVGPEAGYQIAAPIAAVLEKRLLDTSTSRGDLISFGPLFNNSFSRMAELALATGRHEEAFRAVQLNNLSSIVLVNSELAARNAAASPAANAAVRLLQDYVRERRSLDSERSAAASSNAAAELARLEVALKLKDQQIAASAADIDRIFPAFRSLSRPTPVSLAEYRVRLLPDEILLAPLPVEDGLISIAVTQGGLTWHKSPLSRVQVNAHVASIRASIRDAQKADDASAGFDTESAASLYQSIVPKALATTLRAHLNILYYASGSLATIPPALLVTGTPGKSLSTTAWLIRSHPVRVVPSLSPTPAGPSQLTASANFFGVGAPKLGEQQLALAEPLFRSAAVDMKAIRDLPALPRAAEELQNMANVLGNSAHTLLLGGDATEAAVKTAHLDNYAVLAFATHGLVSGDLAGLTEPALVLTPPAVINGNDDGLLTASEIAALHLNADWVILSACNSASGTGTGTPAYAGLASAFTQAGARSLLVSHWPVRDDAAERLTVDTLRFNRKGLPRAEALRQAMLRLMDDAHVPGAANPAVWAPFVLISQ